MRNVSAELPVIFSAEALSEGLRAIYEEKIDVRTEIERHIFEETLRLFNEATAKGLSESYDPALITDRFLRELRTNNAVFSAFKTHRMQNDIARQLIDPVTGQLKSFDRWKLDIRGMTDHYVHAWLQTEYDTAVIRAHQAADWKHFLEEADVFPNIRWMPTTSITPDPLHEHYWTKRLTLPVNHPFWREHRPGDRWNCKCSLQQTDDPVNASALDGWTPPLPQPGLDNNPATDGKLFSDTNPYVTEAYPGADKAVRKAVPDAVFIPSQSIAAAEEFAQQFVAKAAIDRTFKGVISYKGIDLDMANQINQALAEAFSRVDIPKITGIKSISGSSATGKKVFPGGADAIAAYDPINRGIYLNSDVLGSKSKFEAYQKKSREAFETVRKNLDKLPPARRAIAERYIEAGRELVDDSVRGAIYHELGHDIQWQAMKPALFNEISARMSSYASKISGYAGTNGREYIAESFVAWMKGEKIDPELARYFDTLRKKAEKRGSPSSLRRTAEEKERILKEWKERKNRRENDKAIAKALKMKVPNREMTFEEADDKRPNPKWRDSRSYQRNCQCCVVTYELRIRGFNVEAVPKLNKEGSVPKILARRTQLAWIDPTTNAEPELKQTFDLRSLMNEATEIGRYHLRFLYDVGGGHIITFERTKDGIFFYDPQPGIKYTPEEAFKKWGSLSSYSRVKYNSLQYYRVDNLNLNLDYIKAVKKKK